ncbi:MAG: tetratricopeptide repeat protein [Candidatus Xenobia bacterium]
MSRRWTWLLGLAAASCVVALSCQPVVGMDTDFWWHVSSGRLILSSGHVVAPDPLTFTAAGRPWLRYEWGFDVLAALALPALGLGGLVVLRMLAFIGGLALLADVARRRGAAPWAIAATTVWAAWIAAPYPHLRPHYVSFLLLPLTYWLLESWPAERPRARLIALPAVLVAWAAMHGAVSLLGFALCVVYAMGRTRKASIRPHLAGLLGVVVLLTCVPHLLPSIAYFVKWTFTPNPWRQLSSEFVAPTWASIAPVLVLGLPALATALRSMSAGQPTDLLVLAMWAVLLSRAVRHEYLLAPELVPMAALFYSRLRRPAPSWLRGVAAAVLCLITLRNCALVAKVACPPDLLVRWDTLPEGACRFMQRHHLQGHLFNDVSWGGYLSCRLSPGIQTYIDSRLDSVFQPELLGEFETILQGGPRAQALLKQRDVRFIIERIGFDNTPLFLDDLPHDDAWRKVYDDSTARLYVRSDVDIRPSPQDGTWFMEQFVRGDYEAVVAQDPSCCRALLALGVRCAEAGRLHAAQSHWQRALLVQPGVHAVHYDLAVTAARCGDATTAACELQEEMQSGGSVPPQFLERVGPAPWWWVPRSLWLRFWRPLM